MGIKVDIKSNRIFVLKKVAQNIFLSIFVFAFIYLIGNSVNPELINLKNKYVKYVMCFVLIYLLINNFKYSKSLLRYLDIESALTMNRRSGYPIIWIKQSLATNELFLEEYKEKLNLIKAFSPIPIIVFLIGLFLNKGFVINLDFVKSINLESFKILKGEMFVMLSITFFIYYFLKLRATWLKYKILLSEVLQYKKELIYLESEKYKDWI